MKKTSAVFSIIVVLLITTNGLSGQQPAFIDKSRFDTTIHPGDNFYLYINGGYFKMIMQSSSSTVRQSPIDDENQKKLSELLIKISANEYPIGSGEQKISDFINSAMDTVTIEKLSLSPILPAMNKIDGAKNFRQLMRVVGELYKDGGVKLFGLEVRPDKVNSKINIAEFTQAGTTLPFIDKTLYVKIDSAGIKYRKIQKDLVMAFLMALGNNEKLANIGASQILDIERKLSVTHLERYADLSLTYNKMSVKKAAATFPNIGFPELLKLMGINSDTIVIANLAYFQTLNNLLANETLDALKAKVKFDYLYRTAQYLDNDFLKPYQKFINAYRGAQFGKRDFSYNAMVLFRDLVGQLYVKEYVSPGAKQKLKEIALNIRNVFLQKLERSEWMMPETKKVALHKLQNIVMNLAYPDSWESYDDVTINKNQFFANYLSISHHNFRKNIEKIGAAVNRFQWRSTPVSTEGSFSWEENAIAVHAGLLQLPVFDVLGNDAINYSGIGSIIAHELSHGFDDLGRKYDADGNLNNWWEIKDDDQFNLFKNRMIAQYATLIVYDSLHINAKSTFNENLADLNGMIMAYEAFKKTKQGSDTLLTEGLTSDQRFFINYAINRGAYEPKTEGFADRYKSTSVNATHSPLEIRVNGPLSNFEPFYKAFNVTEKNKMYIKASERIAFW